MKVSYLILAHNNFKHLNRLIQSLDNEYAESFYIHIDKKATETYLAINNKTIVIPEHYDINWGGFKMIEATIDLLKYALKRSPNADYYILISGVDYPIRPKQYLIQLLSNGKEYIDITSLPNKDKPIERYEHYYFEYDRRNIHVWNPLFLFEVLMKKLKIKRKIPFTIYAGSQWFALSRNCISYILRTIESDKRYIKFFKHSLVPDEAFFQTIIANSPFADKIATSLVYTDWTVPIPPAVIDNHHIDFLKNNDGYETEYGYTHPYFARKFNDESGGIIERIEKELRKQ